MGSELDELRKRVRRLERDLEESMSGNLVSHAERVVFATYGDKVSVAAKGKDLNKFGVNRVVGSSFETVAQFQGTESNETFVTTNLIDSISSSAAGDTGLVLVVEGHTVDGSGNLTFVVQDATLDGSDARTKVALGTPLARASRIYVKASGSFGSPQSAPSGTVYVYDDSGGVSSGVPTVAAGTKVLLAAGETQTQKCSTSISSSDYWFVSYLSAVVGDTGAASVGYITVQLQTRDVANGGVWRPKGRNLVLVPGQQGRTIYFDPYLIVPKNHDIRVVAKTDTNTADVEAEVGGYLASVV